MIHVNHGATAINAALSIESVLRSLIFLFLFTFLAVDEVARAAKRRRRIGIRRELATTRHQRPHPSVGGSTGYCIHWREAQIDDWSRGRPITACLQSIYNWRERFLPYRQTGNKESENVVGIHQLLLILFLITYPECLLDELSAFIANASHD